VHQRPVRPAADLIDNQPTEGAMIRTEDEQELCTHLLRLFRNDRAAALRLVERMADASDDGADRADLLDVVRAAAAARAGLH
jgi:hypothetical protein